MELTLDSLSKEEILLYNSTMLIYDQGLEMDITIFEKYKIIHTNYLALMNTTLNREIKSEALKRLIFLNWYVLSEPPFLTGIDDLETSVITESYSKLNEILTNGEIDSEFFWMLSYYSCWDWTILMFSEPTMPALTNFVKSVNRSLLHIPKGKLPKGSMNNRGQMGIYWQSVGAEEIL